MIFPNLALWGTKQPNDAVGRIDRALNDRTHRLIVGLSVQDDFKKVNGSLVVSQGHGKYLRLKHVVGESSEIPDSVRQGCLEFTIGSNTDYGQLKQQLFDLASVQASVVEKLKCQAGKYVDRVLAVSVCDPGFWSRDFDGRESYAPMCDSTTLAELSGVSVIDSLPARDLAVRGSGKGLEALPMWLMFADRNQRVASESRGLITIDDAGRFYSLPKSDGLDSDVPEIRKFESVGFKFLDELIGKYFPLESELTYLDQLYADGKQIPELVSLWEQAIQSCVDSQSGEGIGDLDFEQLGACKISEVLVEKADIYLQRNSDLFSNVVRTGICWVLDFLVDRIASTNQAQGYQVDDLIVSVAPQYEACVINRLEQVLSGVAVNSIRKFGVEYDRLPAVVAGVLGLFHVDQMPANIPWITGAQSQRILGALTPGRPSSYRLLLRAMADFNPAPMKLRDAI